MALSIIPRPQFVKHNDGFFVGDGLPKISGDPFFAAEIKNAAERLERAACAAGIAHSVTNTMIYCYREKNAAGRPLNEEGYRIIIDADSITINAAERAGAHHAFETLRQLVLSGNEDGRLVISRAEIIDNPRFRWRGLMLDSSRNFFSPPFIKKLLDALSLHHINVFHWHLTDDQGWRFAVPEYPRLIETGSKRRRLQRRNEEWTGGFYTDADIAALVDYAAALHIDIMPEVDFPGHASAILAAYPELGCTGGPYQVEDRHGIFPDVLCAGRNAVFELAEASFDTLRRLFPFPYVHIGGDEVPLDRWSECPRCQSRVHELGLGETARLQGWLTSRFAQSLRGLGKTPVGWDELLDCSGEQYPLPAETVIMSWRGREGALKAAAAGHQVIMTPSYDGCYLDYRHCAEEGEMGADFGVTTLEQSYMTDPLAGMDAEMGRMVAGGQGNLWTELVYAEKLAEYMIFPRLCALSEAFWSYGVPKDYKRFLRRLKTHQKRLDLLDIMQFRRF